MSTRFRARLVGTRAGNIALTVRERAELLRGALGFREDIGTTFNDQLASRLVSELCSDGKTFIDVGAHIGSVISRVRARSKMIRIIAVEPIPEKAARLRMKFPAVEVHECALAESEGSAEFFVNTTHSGYSSLISPKKAGEARMIRVHLKRLDSIVCGANVDMVKIDVEGAELGVVKGSDSLIDRCRPVIVFESAPPVVAEKRDLWEWFNARDYEILTPNRVAHLAAGLSLEGFLDSHEYPRRTTNYVGVPRERKGEVRERTRAIHKSPGGPGG